MGLRLLTILILTHCFPKGGTWQARSETGCADGWADERVNSRPSNSPEALCHRGRFHFSRHGLKLLLLISGNAALDHILDLALQGRF